MTSQTSSAQSQSTPGQIFINDVVDARQAPPCRICGCTETTFDFARGVHELWRCSQCDFCQIHPQPTSEELQKIYSEKYFDSSKYKDLRTLDRENQRRFDILKKFVPDQGRVLDAGCANGEFITYAKNSYEMWGLDISPYAIQKAREANPSLSDRLFAGVVEDQDFKKEYFDAITLWDVIEHVWDPLAVAEKLLGYIKPGGYLIASTPNIGALTARMFKANWVFMTPPEHLSFFNRQSVDSLFKNQLGQEVVYWDTKGKWANIGFILYKINRMKFKYVPAGLLQWLQKTPLNRFSLYVPSGDIQYMVIKKIK